jgi:hypothetical protein
MSLKEELQFCLFAGLLLFSIISFARSHKSYQFTRHAPYSNVIIFGDSQSDIGNGPESLTYYELNAATGANKIATALYVPISNPINAKTEKVLSNINIDFPPSSRLKQFKLTLPQALPICTNGTCYAKKHRSLNWVEYFIYNAAKNGLISAPVDLRPWIMQYKQRSKGLINQSVDYAWYSAMSNAQCSHAPFPYAPMPCTSGRLSLSASIYQKQRLYRKKQSKIDSKANASLRYQMIIPSLQKQIELFKSDLRSHKVLVNSNTLYIVWTAVNDIGSAFQLYGKKEISSNTLKYQLQYRIPNLIAGNDESSIVNQLIKLGAKHIVVLGQYNLGLTPGALAKRHLGLVRHIIIDKANQLIMLYNTSLRNLITRNFDSTQVKYIDIQEPIAQLVFDHGPLSVYAQTLGEMCDASVSQEGIQKGEAVSCYDNNNRFIGWWNQAHLSTQFNQLIASTVLENLS